VRNVGNVRNVGRRGGQSVKEGRQDVSL